MSEFLVSVIAQILIDEFVEERAELALAPNELVVGAHLDDAAVFEHDDRVRFAQRPDRVGRKQARLYVSGRCVR